MNIIRLPSDGLIIHFSEVKIVHLKNDIQNHLGFTTYLIECTPGLCLQVRDTVLFWQGICCKHQPAVWHDFLEDACHRHFYIEIAENLPT